MESSLIIALLLIVIVLITMTSMFRSNRHESSDQYIPLYDKDENGYIGMSNWHSSHSPGPPQASGLAFAACLGIVALSGVLVMLVAGMLSALK